MLKPKIVIVNKIQTEILYSTTTNQQLPLSVVKIKKLVVVFITGNPGSVMYLKDFLNTLSNKIQTLYYHSVSVYGASHANHHFNTVVRVLAT